MEGTAKLKNFPEAPDCPLLETGSSVIEIFDLTQEGFPYLETVLRILCQRLCTPLAEAQICGSPGEMKWMVAVYTCLSCESEHVPPFSPFAVAPFHA